MKTIAILLLLLCLPIASAMADSPTMRKINIYLNETGGLTPLIVQIHKEKSKEQEINSALNMLSHPEGGMGRTVPETAKVLHVFIDVEKIAYINYSKEISTAHPSGVKTELMTVASIVKTVITNFDISSVQLLIDGKVVNSIAGHIDISEPISMTEVGRWLPRNGR